MSRSFDVSSVADRLAPVDVIRRVFRAVRDMELAVVLIGAAARDLGVLGVCGRLGERATRDVDLAVAIQGFDDLDRLAELLDGRRVGDHRIVVTGVDVDFVPFGPLEVGGEVNFPGETALDVSGLSQASREPFLVTLAPDLTIPVASLSAQVMLKVLAWRDRAARGQHKDAVDLGLLLAASSEGPFGDEVWGDELSLQLVEFDHPRAGPARVGRLAVQELGVEVARVVLGVLDAPGNEEALQVTMNQSTSLDLLDGLRAGIIYGLENPLA